MTDVASSSREDGFTLVELLVAVVLSAVLGGVLFSTLVATQNSSKDTAAQQDLTAEARDALNRMAEDLRVATPVTNGAVTTPALTAIQTTGRYVSLTFNADFDGDGCVAGVASDTPSGATQSCSPAVAATAGAETETFCWDSDPSVDVLYLIAGGVQSGTCTPTSGATPQALLSGKVTSLAISYSSSHYLYDANGDGDTTWQELDSYGAPVGNDNGVPDGPELDLINNVGIELTVSDGSGHQQTFRTQVNLRNVP